MNPYYELKLKYLQKEISLDLYQKSLKLLKQLEERENNKKINQSELINVSSTSKTNQKYFKKQEELEKRKEIILQQQKIRQEHQKKVQEHLELLKNPPLAKKKQKEFLYKISQMNPPEKLEFLNNLEIIKEFGNEHNHSKKVVLLGFIVRKQCQIDSFGNFMFQNEIKSLQKVSPYPHFPILIACDAYNLIIYMTYCGETLDASNIPTDWKNQFEEISQILEVLDVNSNDMLLRNTCIFNGELSIIDFGLDTQFGQGLKTVLKDFYLRLSSISPKKISNEQIERDYHKDYLKWKERLQKTKTLKSYIEMEITNSKEKKKK
jgi:tRNA A-37 threonylcarbamoyl transferase component Bud32